MAVIRYPWDRPFPRLSFLRKGVTGLLALRLLVLILLLVIPLPINIGLAYEGEFFWDEVLDVHGSVMLLIETETGRIVKANQAASAFYGYSLEELVGMGIDEINQLPPDQIERERQDAAALERNYFIFPHRLKDGTVRTVEVYSYPVDPEGRYLFSIIHDITARIEAETTLVDCNQRLKRAEDISGIGHWEFHLTENRVVASEGAKRIYGLGDEEWTITAVQTIPLPQYREMLDLALANLIEKGEPYDVEFRIRHPSDGAIVDIRSIAEYDPEREVVFGTVMDVTQYHQLVRVAETQRNEIIVVIALLLLVSIGGIVILARHLRLRKRSEEQLAQSLDALREQRAALAQQERQFRELFQNSISAISVFRLVYEAGNPEDCVFLRVNAAFEKYTGLRPDDVIGRRVTEILPDFRETGLLGISDEVLRTGKPRTIVMYFALLQRYYYVSLYSTSDDQLAVIFNDITDRKLAEEELRRSTQLLEDAQRLGRLGGWEWDVKEERLLWTKETYRIHGLDPENVSLSSRELMEISFRCFAEPERTIIEGAFLRCQMTGTPYDLELPMTTVDGDPRWVRVVAYAVFDHEGKVAKVLGNMVDITERKQAEVELQNSEQRFRKLVELAPDAIFVEIDGKFTYLNDAALSLFGVTRPEELIGKPVLDRIAPEYKETVAQQLHKLNVERERVPRNEEVFLQVDGTRVDVEVAAVPIQFQAEWGALVYARDITQRKQAEEQLRYLTFHDPVTGLYNRTFLEQKLKELDTEASLPLGVLMADVNGLKVINDSLGHQQGDVLLKRVGQILQEACHPTDTIGRWGGDEFVALLPHTTEARLREICTRIEQACEEEGFVPFYISLAVGYAVKEREEESIDEVIKAAEDAMYQRKMNEALSNKSALVTSLQRALGEKSHETEHHARRLQQMAVALGERWGLSGAQLDEVSLLALLHDIGKVAISEEILMKEGKLTMEEREIIRRHPEIGYRIATASPDLAVVAEGILSHHERWDGRGYPRGLKGEDIPLSARIVAIVDAFEAMTSGRPYCEKMSTEEALQEIMACAGSQFDPKFAKVFVEMIRDWEQSSAESAASDDHEGQGM